MRRNAKYLVFANNGVACKIYSIGHGSVLKQIRLPTIGFAQQSVHPVSAALRGANCLTLGRTPRTGAGDCRLCGRRAHISSSFTRLSIFPWTIIQDRLAGRLRRPRPSAVLRDPTRSARGRCRKPLGFFCKYLLQSSIQKGVL